MVIDCARNSTAKRSSGFNPWTSSCVIQVCNFGNRCCLLLSVDQNNSLCASSHLCYRPLCSRIRVGHSCSLVVQESTKHEYRESKRIIVLLATAAAIAQSMNLHRLGPDPSTALKPQDFVTREIHKRIWCFLVVQDSYLVSFRKTFCILPESCTTPEPQNCYERGADVAGGGIFDPVPLSTPTRISYMILQ